MSLTARGDRQTLQVPKPPFYRRILANSGTYEQKKTEPGYSMGTLQSSFMVTVVSSLFPELSVSVIARAYVRHRSLVQDYPSPDAQNLIRLQSPSYEGNQRTCSIS